MPVTKDDIIRTASLARLRLSEAEIDSMRETLDKIFQYIDQLHEVPTDGVEPLHHVLDFPLTPQADQPHECLSRDEALKGSHDHSEEYFRLPRVIN